MLRALFRSASLRTAIVMGFGGLAFTGGSLLFARVLTPSEYGLLSLFVGILGVSCLTAPLGLDILAARRGLHLGTRLRRLTVMASALTAVLTVAAGALFYRLEGGFLASMLVATFAGGLNQASTAQFQGQRQFGTGAWILQASNIALLVAAVAAALLGVESATPACSLIAGAGLLLSAASWWLALKHPGRDVTLRPATLWSEALALMTITTGNALFLQLERLVIPPALGVRDLAVFGVLAALVGSPFRMIQSAVLFTVIPGLRAARGIAERRRLLAHEVRMVTAVMACGAAVIFLVAPPVAHWLLAGRYELTTPLMIAAVVSGVLKVISAFATASVIALAQETNLRRLSLLSWMSIGLSIAGAFVGARWGLTGLLYGVSAGWVIRSFIAILMAIPYLRSPPGAQLRLPDLSHPSEAATPPDAHRPATPS